VIGRDPVGGDEVLGACEGDGGHEVLRTAHGGAYELGMREAPANLPIQPFPDP
jgi:hypothetical protein